MAPKNGRDLQASPQSARVREEVEARQRPKHELGAIGPIFKDG